MMRTFSWVIITILFERCSGVGEENFEQRLTTFSPSGRLYQVEYAAHSARATGFSTVAIRGQHCCVVASQIVKPSFLLESSSAPAVFSVTPEVGCCVSGVPGDGLALVEIVRKCARAFRRRYGHDPSASRLALDLADHAQRCTCEAPTRPLGATVLLIGGAPTPELWRVDPTGQFFQCKGVCVGQGYEEATKVLQQLLDGKQTRERSRAGNLATPNRDNVGDGDDATVPSDDPVVACEADTVIGLALECLGRQASIAQQDAVVLTAEHVQVGIVTCGESDSRTTFRVLPKKQVAAALLSIRR
mmetsp:Transcript_18800/g.34280  ORF Transcript_18800/g.34280 Transcript_18800/m.34280 type:complete len:302 (-) Transcript_18800:203-1108(-)